MKEAFDRFGAAISSVHGIENVELVAVRVVEVRQIAVRCADEAAEPIQRRDRQGVDEDVLRDLRHELRCETGRSALHRLKDGPCVGVPVCLATTTSNGFRGIYTGEDAIDEVSADLVEARLRHAGEQAPNCRRVEACQGAAAIEMLHQQDLAEHLRLERAAGALARDEPPHRPNRHFSSDCSGRGDGSIDQAVECRLLQPEGKAVCLPKRVAEHYGKRCRSVAIMDPRALDTAAAVGSVDGVDVSVGPELRRKITPSNSTRPIAGNVCGRGDVAIPGSASPTTGRALGFGVTRYQITGNARGSVGQLRFSCGSSTLPDSSSSPISWLSNRASGRLKARSILRRTGRRIGTTVPAGGAGISEGNSAQTVSRRWARRQHGSDPRYY